MAAIILVRHAEPEQLPPGVGGHWTDTALSDLGRRQAAAVAARLKDEIAGLPCRLASSSLKRAAQTADAIAEALGIDPAGIDRAADLREYNDGKAQGGTLEALRGTAPDGAAESWQTFYDRVAACMERLTAGEDRLLVVVSHYGAMINIVTWWLGVGLAYGDARVSFDAQLACITVLRENRQGRHTIERLNDLAHLMPEGLCRPIQLEP